MGFDNECIVNIQSLAGEYFCPVCRLLVYPNEAIQSQCTHLYCKPCLAYVVGTTRACPYDGYLVTEADSKPLIESNKALAETIGNIAVHCLYHRSGCTWQGPLSECTSHCSGCAFGNSPVVCNRCGVQIVHRQVQEHAQTCPGVQPQTQQALGAPDTSAAGTATAADPSQTAVQSGTQSSQGQTTQATAAPPPGQDPNQQSSGNPQAQTVAPAAAPTPEQWYQQQYQQYYQQYPGYDPYHQTYQHSYPYQQQAQHVQGQHQPQVYTQPQAQPPLQPQAQAQPQPQPHAPPQPHQNIQVPVAAQHQNQAQGNLQQQVHPPIQMQSQTHAPPHGHPHPQPHPQSYPQGQPLPHLVQMPQYQQPPPQMQHPQPPIQPQHHSLPQPPAHSLAQPQAHVQHQPHSHPQINPPLQPNQPPNTNAHPQTQQPSAHAVTVTGHQSYPQPQAVQQMQLGAPQHPMQMHPHGGPPPQHPTQMHSQFPQQPPQMRPPQSHTPIHNQQHSALLPLQGQSGQQMLHPHSQQPGQPVQQRPVMQPIQQPVPQQLMQQQPFPGQTSGPVQNQLHQQAHLTPPPPPPMQSHLRPPPHSYMQSQQNVIHAPQPQQSQNFVGRPMMSNHGAQSQPFPQPTSGFTGPAQVRPMQFGANPQSANLNPLPRTNNQPLMSSEQQNFQSGMALKPPMFERQGDHMSKSVAEREAGLPSHITAKTEANGLVPTGVGADSVEARTLKSEADLKFSDSDQKPRGGDKDGTQHVDTHTLAKDTDFKLHAVENGSGEPAIKSMVKKEGIEGSVEPSFGGTETVVKEQRDSTDVPKPVDQSDSLEEHSDKLPKDVVENSLPVSTGADKGSHDIPLAPARVLDSSVHDVAPQGNSQTPTGRDPLQQGFQERNTFQSQIAPQGPGVDEPRGFPPQGHGFPHQQPTMHYGPPTHQQRPAAPPPRPLHQGYGPGQPPSMLRPQVPGEFSHTGPPLNPTDHFQTPMKQPYGSFPPEVPSGGNSGPGSTSSFGRGPTHFGPPQGSFELESSGPLGHYNHGRGPPPHVGGGPPPGSFDPHGGIMGRAPPHGPEGQFVQQRPNSQMEAEIFPDQRSRNFDGRRIDTHLPGTWEKGPLGQPPGIESNAMRMKLAPGIDSSSTLGYGDERFKPPPEEQFNPFPLEPARRLERGSRPHDKAPFGDNYDAGSGGAPSRFLPSYHSPGTFHPNEAGERVRPFGSDDNFGRADTSRTHPDFLKPAAGFGRHHMDRSTPRSPGREYPSIPPRGFGGVPRRQSGVDDIDGGQSRPFGEGFHGSRFPLSPGHLRRGEHDGPGILRGGDFTEQDILPSHLRRGEMLSHQNLPGHLRFGDPSGFGGFPSGPGNLPHGFPPGESFGGKKSSHPRLGEPGFRSSYSLQGFPNDGGFFTSSMDSIDNSRKRKPTSMGWCRICRVDCETVEGLDMHSQTREHQKKAMDMVLSIKQQNAKRQKKPNDRSSREEASKSRSAVYEGRGNKA